MENHYTPIYADGICDCCGAPWCLGDLTIRFCGIKVLRVCNQCEEKLKEALNLKDEDIYDYGK